MTAMSRPTRSIEIAKSVGLDVAEAEGGHGIRRRSATILEANHALAQTLGIQGTPAFIIDETLIPGDRLSTA